MDAEDIIQEIVEDVVMDVATVMNVSTENNDDEHLNVTN